jgi:hypothetical protein
MVRQSPTPKVKSQPKNTPFGTTFLTGKMKTKQAAAFLFSAICNLVLLLSATSDSNVDEPAIL